MTDVVIASACRTPIGKFQGSLAGFTAPQLGTFAASEAIRRAGLQPEQIDETIMGNVLGAGLGPITPPRSPSTRCAAPVSRP